MYIVDYFDYKGDGSLGTSNPLQLELTGHKSDGFGLAWNNYREGQLFSCGNDSQVLMWELGKLNNKN